MFNKKGVVNMEKLSREQKISNLKKVFNDSGYQHDFVRKVSGDMLKGDEMQTEDYFIASYYNHHIDSDKKQLRILSGTETTKRTSNNKIISRQEPYEWFLTLEDAENLICFLEAFIEIEKEQGVA
jgi:hypothetical protein|tara:strand:+ start:121 stop:495 length:375 start_codon:yes stop_codon:yes gene_type:complete